MKNRTPLLLLALFALAAFGINSVMFTEMSHEMAVTFRLSLDETDRVKIAMMIAQVLGYLFSPLLVRHFGAYRLLMFALGGGLVCNIVLYLPMPLPGLFWLTWVCAGFSMSIMLVTINLLLLHTFDARWMPAIIALTLLFSTLLPMGAYPWLVADVLEQFNWSLFCVLASWLYFSALIILSLFKPISVTLKTKKKSGALFYVPATAAISLTIYLLMRGGFYNWFDSVQFAHLAAITAALILLVVYLLVRHRHQNTASMQIHARFKTNVFMYNAFLAGFAVMASSALFSNFLKKTLHYNALSAGHALLPSFVAMVAGMLVSVLVYYFRRQLADAVVPFGVLMILISVKQFSELPSYAGAESLPLPMLLRGFGVGMLNVSVTIAVLMYFNADDRLEGIANFYLFRTMGGVIGGAFLSRVTQQHSAQASGELGRTLEASSQSFSAYQHALNSELLTNGYLPQPALGMSQIHGVVKEQTITLALNNSLIMFIVSILVLAPILLVGKKLVAKKESNMR